MPEGRTNRTRWALAVALLLAVTAPASADASDLTTYRNFKFGTDVATVAQQTGVDASRVRILHSRPAPIQELERRPGYLGPTTEPDTVKDVMFTFYGGVLCRIAVTYERHATEGMTVEDFTDAISAAYGTPTKPTAPATPLVEGYGGSEEVVAQWRDAHHRYDLIRSAYGPTFRLVGTLNELEALARAAVAEATRLDDKEAPQREAARQVRKDEAAAARLDEARLVNKPKFRH